jgi:hypothetical protein
VRFIAGLVWAFVLLAVAGGAYIYSGAFNVVASTPYNAFEQWLFGTTMKRSVVAGSRDVSQPPPFTDDMIRDGSDHYEERCTVCHGGAA